MKTVETGTNFQKNLYKSRFLLIHPTSLQKIQEKTFSPISFYGNLLEKWNNAITQDLHDSVLVSHLQTKLLTQFV